MLENPPPGLARRLLTRLMQIFLVHGLVLGLLLLVSGDPKWQWAWVNAALAVGRGLLFAGIVLVCRRETLAAPGEWAGGPDWDRWTVAAWAIAFFVVLPVVAGLDARFGWTPFRVEEEHLAGGLMVATGTLLLGWALAVNAYFIPAARLQPERGQTVCAEGPYRLVRHPGYLATLLACLGVPVLLGTLWALIPAAIAGAAIVVRTALEDRMMRDHLDGYETYTRAVGARLVPGFW